MLAYKTALNITNELLFIRVPINFKGKQVEIIVLEQQNINENQKSDTKDEIDTFYDTFSVDDEYNTFGIPEKAPNNFQKLLLNAPTWIDEEYQKYAFNVAFRILCNEEDAKDVVQDSFIKIWKNIINFNTELKFTTWMYKIVILTAIDKRKTLKQRRMVSLDAISNTLGSIERDGPDTRLNNEQLGNVIEEFSAELPEKQRLVFILRDIQGLESNEVETILDMNESSVKSNLYHARQIVRRKLEKIRDIERRI